MFFGDSDSSKEFDSPFTLFDLDLSPLKEVRSRSESDIEHELEFIKDPDYIPPLTPCSESYETEDMSLEETLTIGGSEEVKMVEEVSIRTVLFGSEKTMEEVGGEEGVEGKGVPSNILEVKGVCERCYDVEVDIVFEVMGYETEWPTSDSLVYLVETYDLPLQVEGKGVPSNILEVKGVCERVGVRKRKAGTILLPECPIRTRGTCLVLGHHPSRNRRKNSFLLMILSGGGGMPKWDAEVEFLSTWKAKKVNQNKYSLNEDEEEEVKKLVREEDDFIYIMYLTSLDVVEAVELYEVNSLKMDKFLAVVGGMAIPKKSKTSAATVATSQGGEDVGPAQKRMKVEEQECRGDKVVDFILRPPPIQLNLELRDVGVITHSKGKSLVPTPSQQGSLFDTKSMITVKRFINSTFPEVDCRRAQEEVLGHSGVGIVKHILKEFFETLKERNILVKEKEELGKKKEEVEKDLAKLPTVILAFSDCRKKVKAQHPKLDVIGITFGEQEGRVDEDGEKGEPKARSAEVEGAEVAENELEQEIDQHPPPEVDQPPPPTQ
ncbi:hypothetical protein SLEP1_g10894 [Rubroshorea leprosula]|uniref:Uncharacterized protein n=1 Tax=Rubroshorea leprosula TaxID=152421 RepID=A0AAV5I9K8_9ROSI|nr:hypothetical protein SLEP1_g10894 [Rubroshorea leprosula]